MQSDTRTKVVAVVLSAVVLFAWRAYDRSQHPPPGGGSGNVIASGVHFNTADGAGAGAGAGASADTEWESVWDGASNKHYYYSKVTGAVTWDKPHQLMTANERSAAAGAGAAAVSAKGSDWEQAVDPKTGKTYFWNTKTEAVSWTKPAELSAAEPATAESESASASESADAEWEAVTTEDGTKTYWWNTRTEEVTWEKPSASKPAAAAAKPAAKPAAGAKRSAAGAASAVSGAEWHQLTEPGSGATYYWHVSSNQVQWTLPDGVSAGTNPTVPDSHARSVLSGEPVWQEVRDRSPGAGTKTYFWHRLTGATTFTRPPASEPVAPAAPSTTSAAAAAGGAAAAASVWLEDVDLASHRPYYWNRATGVTTWDKPDLRAGATIAPGPTAHCKGKAEQAKAAKRKADDNASTSGAVQLPYTFPFGGELRAVTDVYAETSRQRAVSRAECKAPTLAIVLEKTAVRPTDVTGGDDGSESDGGAREFPFVGMRSGGKAATCAKVNGGVWLECNPNTKADAVAAWEPFTRRLYVARLANGFVDAATAHPDAPGTVFDASAAYYLQPSVRPPKVDYDTAVVGVDGVPLEPRIVWLPQVATALQVYPTSESHFRAETLPKLLWLHEVLPASVPIVVSIDAHNAAYLEYLYTTPAAAPALDRKRIIRHSAASVYGGEELYFAGEWPSLPTSDSHSPYAGSRTTSYPREHMDRVRRAFGVDTAPAPAASSVVIVVGGALTSAVAKELASQLRSALPKLKPVLYTAGEEGVSDTAASAGSLGAAVKAVGHTLSVFRGARVVIGGHGSALSHIVFAPPGAVVVELGATKQTDSLFYRMSIGLQHDYWLLPDATVKPADVVALLTRGGERNGKPAKPAL